ncbi:homocysteine S-methyltransferase family protein [Promethearchaeum syntrophicum]|uniref:methionine synthase n=1 Tax=Promethearchaeum syntrophicum TaxID=2594042 RepID=A0A5B9D6Q5_9ARCH|nr:homocysteine S-methyltransferase family protein [Candidatus Prometheoarchaeum syntrophicum]QEE14653.1 Dimethylamine corrinoid protein [Candidatus Prometheoarchaeum syntrophicum]
MSFVKKIFEENKKKFILFDSAMGTTLQKMGLKAGEIPELFNFTHSDVILDIHKQNIEAGSDIIITNTFGANEIKLKGCLYSVEDVVQKAVSLARKAAGKKYVALDLGPTGQLLEPLGSLKFEQAYDLYKRQVIAGTDAGADLIIIETISDLYEAKAAILAAKENSNLPVFCTMTFDQNGRTLTGTDPITMVNVLEGLGVDVIGVNCSLGPKDILPIVDEILKYATIPVMVQPNAGLPDYVDGETVFNVTPEEFATVMVEIAKKGVRILGGCCGTTPEFILKLHEKLKNIDPSVPKPVSYTCACSSTKTVIFDANLPKIIGERINPTGNGIIKNALINQDYGAIINEAIAQKDAGADILDVNIGLPEIDEPIMMVKVIKELQGIIDIPLQIDSANIKTLEAGARIFNGKTILNSVTGKKNNMEQIFPIAKKYGACVIGLTMDERGLPKTIEQRVEIAEKIITTAKQYGIPKKDILIDCLVLTASTHQDQVLKSLKAMQIIKQKFGVKTVLGASNISFGLPRRDLINQTYMAMALTYGLDAPITDPLVPEIIETIFAFRILSNTDKNSEDFINKFGNNQSEKQLLKEETKESLSNIIIKGLLNQVEQKTQDLLKNTPPLSIIDEHLIPSLDIVGDMYDQGDIFLPQLIRSAETVKKAFKIIKSTMPHEDEKGLSKGKILLATVAGDVHDIGKNIVKVLLENYGFTVIDLGKDVPIDSIVSTCIEQKIKLVGLSALMTPTVENMKKTIEKLQNSDKDCRIMVGGAVLNEKYAKMINADYYGKDARQAVEIAQTFFRNN